MFFFSAVCNIIVHEKCLKTVALPCVSIAATLVKNPVAHVWSDRTLIKRKFCNVCRKKIEDVLGMSCEGKLSMPTRGKSHLELWVTTFLPDWQPPLIFVWFISNFFFMCSSSMASAHVILQQIRQRLRVAVSSELWKNLQL